LGDVEFAKAASNATYTANTVVDFGGAAVKYVRLTANSNWGGLPQMGLSEVRFLYIPAHPREPQPADGATGVDPQAPLTWRAGREAGSHEVYLGSDPAELTLVETVGQATYAPDNLEFGSTYYWQIVEVNAVEAISAWEGAVWNFSTEAYALIDGFETYNDDIEAGTAIFDTWFDGWVNDNGATVGYFDAPFAEKTIVHSGGQSMPLAYDNTASPFYSEAERVFDSAQNWSVNGADALVLYFQGVPGPFVELASGKIIMGAAGADIWNAADEFRFVYKPLNGNGSIVAYVESVANTDPWAKGGVMIRETLDAGSTFAAVYSTPGNGCRYQARLTSDVAAVSDSGVATPEQIALLAPHWVKIERIGNTFNGYYSTDGENWTSMSWNPQTIAMTSNVYIGLALTSHSAGVLASAEFSDIATTGNVTGQWAVETIGPARRQWQRFTLRDAGRRNGQDRDRRPSGGRRGRPAGRLERMGDSVQRSIRREPRPGRENDHRCGQSRQSDRWWCRTGLHRRRRIWQAHPVASVSMRAGSPALELSKAHEPRSGARVIPSRRLPFQPPASYSA
jgi:hypothetical protein